MRRPDRPFHDTPPRTELTECMPAAHHRETAQIPAGPANHATGARIGR
jgi:hypothetical protein